MFLNFLTFNYVESAIAPKFCTYIKQPPPQKEGVHDSLGDTR